MEKLKSLYKEISPDLPNSGQRSTDQIPNAVNENPTREAQQNGGSEDAKNSDEEAIAEKEIEVAFDKPFDPMNPKNMSGGRKWLITFVVAFSSACVTTNSSIITFTYDQLIKDFSISQEVATLGLTFFVVGLGLGPMFLAPLSEFYGRRIIYISAFSFVLIWIIPCMVAQNIQTIIVTRFFDGVAASVFLSVAGGTIGDMFEKRDLSFPMMVYSGSPFLGPALGPIIGGFINQYAYWQWTFRVLLIWTAVQLLLIILLIPETYAPVLIRRKAQRLRKDTGNASFIAPIERTDKSIPKTILWSCIRPFQLLFLEPMVLNLCLLSAVLLGILYLFFGAFPLIFENNHGFSLSQVGLTFLGLFTGMILAILSDPLFQRIYRRLVKNLEQETGDEGATEPEFRLPPTIVGAQCVWIGLFTFGWTTFSYVHWIAPIIFSGLIGFGIVTCYAGIFTFLVESYPLYAASALAANSIARSLFAAIFPLFGVYMYDNLGYQWATSLLAFLTLALAPFPYIFFRYGRRIRKYSKFAT